MPYIIPLVAIVMGCSIPIALFFFDYIKRRRIYELHHQERMAAIEKGVEMPPLPPDLNNGETPAEPRGPRYLLKGLIWSFLGLSLTIAMHKADADEATWFGLVPLGIGFAYLLYYLIEGRKAEEELRKTETKPAIPGSTR